LDLTRGLDDDQGSKRVRVDSDEDSCGDDSDYTEKIGLERRLIRPQIKPLLDGSKPLVRERKDDSLMSIFKF
jgi:hypothetical protein